MGFRLGGPRRKVLEIALIPPERSQVPGPEKNGNESSALMIAQELSPQQVQEQRQNDNAIILLDCREQDEFDTVHIDGAELYPMSELAERLAELEVWKDRKIIVYCHHGVRSRRVAQWLMQQGFPEVANMAGGIDRWALEIQPQMTRY